MSKRVIYVDLSEEGIDYALKELEKFKKDFITACNELTSSIKGDPSASTQYLFLGLSSQIKK